MAHEGYIDQYSATEIRGWIFDNSHPDQPLEIEVLEGDRVVERRLADEFRADLLAAGKGGGAHAFHYRHDQPTAIPLSVRVAGKRWKIPLSGALPPIDPVPVRFDAELRHTLEYGPPGAVGDQGFSLPTSSPDEPAIIERLILAYHRTLADHPDGKHRKADQWASLAELFHQDVIDLLHRSDSEGLARYLRDAHAKGLTHGITQGHHTTGVLRQNPDARRLVMMHALDHLVSLAESIGLLDVECPDQHGQWGENFHRDPSTLVDLISRHLGISVVLPQVLGSAFGIKTSEGILSTRDLLALYAALRLRTVATTQGHPKTKLRSVCEIGGGLGGVAYYANRLGIENYTIIDLPLVSVLQGYFLMRALPGVAIRLYGEETPNPAIQLLPTYVFEQPFTRFDILFNQDSMPEMHREYSLGYLEHARKKGLSLFLSINQEARAPQNVDDQQTVVRDLVAQTGGFERHYRFRHWLRAGYVEELYAIA